MSPRLLSARFGLCLAWLSLWTLAGCALTTEETFYGPRHDASADTALADAARADATSDALVESGADVIAQDVDDGADRADVVAPDGCIPSPEVCDGVDNDCDGQIDNGVGTVFYRDADGDGFGDSTMTVTRCTAPAGYVATGGDCADSDPQVHPGAMEVCNNVDDDCDGTADNGIAAIPCGVGACARTVPGCIAGAVPMCVPGAPSREWCNGRDDDCDGTIDNGVPTTSCGIGACRVTVPACAGGALAACVPAMPSAEVCGDGVDNDCNGVVDDGCTCTRYVAPGATGDGLSPATPTGTIQGAITSLQNVGATGTVCVAATANGTGCTLAMYSEAVTMAEGVSVLGGFHPGTPTWTRDPSCVVLIQDTTTNGVFFGHNITNATALSGFWIRGMLSSNAGISLIAAVTMQAGGVVANNLITGSPAPVAVGIRLIASSPPAVNPLIVGNSIHGGSGTGVVSSYGILGNFVSPQVRNNVVIDSGAASSISTGIDLTDAPGNIVADNQRIAGGYAARTVGARFSGATSSVVMVRNGDVAGGAGSTNAAGVVFEGCSAATSTVSANSIVGATAAGSGAGVQVANSRADVDSNALIAGKNAAGLDGNGVWCTGTSAVCNVRGNARIAGFETRATGGENARGVYVNSGATGVVSHNASIVGCTNAARACHGVFVESAGGVVSVDGNAVEVNNGTTWDNGVYVRLSNAVVSNNLVLVTGGQGIALDTHQGTAVTEAVVHSNTLVGVPDLMTTGRATILLQVENENTAGAPNGVFRNNIAFCGGATSSLSFRELGAAADPRVLENNDLLGCSALYFDADTGAAIASIAQVNALADVPTRGANVSVDPMFVTSPRYHLSTTSPVIDQGTPAGAPAFDIDGDPRPLRSGFDIGADEAR